MSGKPKMLWWPALQPTLMRKIADGMMGGDNDRVKLMGTIARLSAAYKLLPLDHMGHESLRALHTSEVLIGTN